MFLLPGLAALVASALVFRLLAIGAEKPQLQIAGVELSFG
jgi:hypothetical protein